MIGSESYISLGKLSSHPSGANPFIDVFLARPNNHVVLDPISNSPLLQRSGFTENEFTKLGQHLRMDEWVKVRQTQQQRRTKAPKIEGQSYEYKEKELEIIPGLHAKIYN